MQYNNIIVWNMQTLDAFIVLLYEAWKPCPPFIVTVWKRATSIILLLFFSQKKISQVWNNMKENKRWQNLYFWVNYAFNQRVSESIPTCTEETQSALNMCLFGIVRPHFDIDRNERLIPVVHHNELYTFRDGW